MPVTPAYRAYVEDQLGRVVDLRSRPMFGGVGLYDGDAFFGLVDDDVLYFKVDDATRARYQGRGMRPFQPGGEGPSMSYYSVPPELVDDVEALAEWAREAADAARRAKKSKRTPAGRKSR